MKGMLVAAWRYRFFSPINTESLTYLHKCPLANAFGQGHDAATYDVTSFAFPARHFSVDV